MENFYLKMNIFCYSNIPAVALRWPCKVNLANYWCVSLFHSCKLSLRKDAPKIIKALYLLLLPKSFSLFFNLAAGAVMPSVRN